jgi:hypothetical protein
MTARTAATVLEAVGQRSGRTPCETEQFERERQFLEAFYDGLESDDEVWILGARAGLYAVVAAEVVGAESVTVVDGDGGTRERVQKLLSTAGLGRVDVRAATELSTAVATPSGDPGVAEPERDTGASTASGVETPTPPSVLVIDTPAAERDLLERLSLGHFLSVRFMLVKSDDHEAARRLAAVGYETTRYRQFNPLRTPWQQVVVARRDPDLPVTPVPTGLFSGVTGGVDDAVGVLRRRLPDGVGHNALAGRLAVVGLSLVGLLAGVVVVALLVRSTLDWLTGVVSVSGGRLPDVPDVSGAGPLELVLSALVTLLSLGFRLVWGLAGAGLTLVGARMVLSSPRNSGVVDAARDVWYGVLFVVVGGLMISAVVVPLLSLVW